MSRYVDAASAKYLREGRLAEERAQALADRDEQEWRGRVASRRQALMDGHGAARAAQKARQEELAATGRAAAAYRRAEETQAYGVERFLVERHERTQQRISQRAAASSAREIADFMQALKNQPPPPAEDPTQGVLQRARARRLATEEATRSLQQERDRNSGLFAESRSLARGYSARAPLSGRLGRSGRATTLAPGASGALGTLGQIGDLASRCDYPREESSSDIDLPICPGAEREAAGEPGEPGAVAAAATATAAAAAAAEADPARALSAISEIRARTEARVPGLVHVSLAQELSYLRERAGMEREDKERRALALEHARLLAENSARSQERLYLSRARDVDDLVSVACEICSHGGDAGWTKVLWERYLSCETAPDAEYRERCAFVDLLASEEVDALVRDFVNAPDPEEKFLLQERLLDDVLQELNLTQSSGASHGRDGREDQGGRSSLVVDPRQSSGAESVQSAHAAGESDSPDGGADVNAKTEVTNNIETGTDAPSPRTFVEFVKTIPDLLRETEAFQQSGDEPLLVDGLSFRVLPQQAPADPAKSEVKSARSGSKGSKRPETGKRVPNAEGKRSATESPAPKSGVEDSEPAPPEAEAALDVVHTGSAVPLFTLALCNATEVAASSLQGLADSLSALTGGLALSPAEVVSNFAAYREEYLRFNSQLLSKISEAEKAKGKKKEGAASPAELAYVFNDRFATLPPASSVASAGAPAPADFDRYLKLLQAPYKDSPADAAVYAVLLARVNYMLRRSRGLPVYSADSTEYHLRLDFGASQEEVQAKIAALEAEQAEASLSLRRRSRNAHLARASAMSAVSAVSGGAASGRASSALPGASPASAEEGEAQGSGSPSVSPAAKRSRSPAPGSPAAEYQACPIYTPGFVLFLLPYKSPQSIADIEAAFAPLHSLRAELYSRLGVTPAAPKPNSQKGALLSTAFDRVVYIAPLASPTVVRSDTDEKGRKDAKKKDAPPEEVTLSPYTVWDYESLKGFSVQAKEDPELQKVQAAYASAAFGLDSVFGPPCAQAEAGAPQAPGVVACSPDDIISGLRQAYSGFCLRAPGASGGRSSSVDSLAVPDPSSPLYNLASTRDILELCYQETRYADLLASRATPRQLMAQASSRILAAIEEYGRAVKVHAFDFEEMLRAFSLHYANMRYEFVSSASQCLSEVGSDLRELVSRFLELLNVTFRGAPGENGPRGRVGAGKAEELSGSGSSGALGVPGRPGRGNAFGGLSGPEDGAGQSGQVGQPGQPGKRGGVQCRMNPVQGLTQEQLEQRARLVSDFRSELESRVNAWRAYCERLFWQQRGREDDLGVAEAADAGLAAAVASGDYSGKTSPLFADEAAAASGAQGLPNASFLPAYFDYPDMSTKYRFLRPLGFLLRAADRLAAEGDVLSAAEGPQAERTRALCRELEARYGPLGLSYVMEQDLPEGYGSPAELEESGSRRDGPSPSSQKYSRPHTYAEVMTNCLLISFRAIALDTVRLFGTVFYSLVNLIYAVNDQEHRTEAASGIEAGRIVSGRDPVTDKIRRDVGAATEGLPMGHEVGRGGPREDGTAGAVGASNGAMGVAEARRSVGLSPSAAPGAVGAASAAGEPRDSQEAPGSQRGSRNSSRRSSRHSSRAGSRTGPRPGSRAAHQGTALGPQPGCGLTRIRREDLDYETFCDEFLADFSLSLSTRPLFAISKGQASWVWAKKDDKVCRLVVDLVERYHEFLQAFVYRTVQSLVKGIQMGHRQTQIRCNDILTAQYLSFLGDIKRLCDDTGKGKYADGGLCGPVCAPTSKVAASAEGASSASARSGAIAKSSDLGLFRGEVLDRERLLLEYTVGTLKRLPRAGGEGGRGGLEQPTLSSTAGEVARMVLPPDAATSPSATLMAAYSAAQLASAGAGTGAPSGFSAPMAEAAAFLLQSSAFTEAYGGDGLDRDVALRLPEGVVAEIVQDLPLDAIYSPHNAACQWGAVLRQGALESLSEKRVAFLEEQQASKKKQTGPVEAPDNDYSLVWPAFLLQASVEPLTLGELGFFISQFREVCGFDAGACVSAEGARLRVEREEAEAASQARPGARSTSLKAAPKTARGGKRSELGEPAEGKADDEESPGDTPLPAEAPEPPVPFGETEEYRRLKERFLEYSVEGPFSREIFLAAGRAGRLGPSGDAAYGECVELAEPSGQNERAADQAVHSEASPATVQSDAGAGGRSALQSAVTANTCEAGDGALQSDRSRRLGCEEHPEPLKHRPATFWRRYNIAARAFLLEAFAPLLFDRRQKDIFFARVLACLCFDRAPEAVDAKLRAVLGLSASNEEVLKAHGVAAFSAARSILNFGVPALDESLARPLLIRDLATDLEAARASHTEAAQKDLASAIEKATAEFQKASKGKKASK